MVQPVPADLLEIAEALVPDAPLGSARLQSNVDGLVGAVVAWLEERRRNH
jgi:hypothetical protein